MSEPTPEPSEKAPRWRLWLLEGLIFCATFVAFQLWQTRGAVQGPVPAFAGTLVNGQSFDLNAWRAAHPGQPALIYFWAEWCGICRTTAGNVAAIGQDWPVITIAAESGDAAAVAKTMAERDYRWPTLPDPSGSILRQYGLRGVPAFIVIDPDGNIRSTQLGYTSELGLRLRLWWAARNT